MSVLNQFRFRVCSGLGLEKNCYKKYVVFDYRVSTNGSLHIYIYISKTLNPETAVEMTSGNLGGSGHCT